MKDFTQSRNIRAIQNNCCVCTALVKLDSCFRVRLLFEKPSFRTVSYQKCASYSYMQLNKEERRGAWQFSFTCSLCAVDATTHS